jgi:hypothetical protein
MPRLLLNRGVSSLRNSPFFFYTVKCKDPTVQVRNSVQVIGYSEPALEGMNITFLCPSNYLLMGTSMSTCAENGEWEPDPKDMECKGKIKNLIEGCNIKSILILSPHRTNFPREPTS